jgi:hypothetical protein
MHGRAVVEWDDEMMVKTGYNFVSESKRKPKKWGEKHLEVQKTATVKSEKGERA